MAFLLRGAGRGTTRAPARRRDVSYASAASISLGPNLANATS